MTQLTVQSQQNYQFGTLWRRGWHANKPLMFTGVFSILLLAIAFIGLAIDPRTLLGESIWIKPAKFAISSVFYSLTLLWFLSLIQNRPRLVRIVAWTTTVTLLGELILITLQAVRGVRSHFNVATPFDTAVFSTMGMMIFALWVASLIALIVLMRQRFENDVWGITLKWALLLTVIGSALGFLMTNPTAAQMAMATETGMMAEAGAHSVGVADGGPGLPFVGWSTIGGDLRIGHFFGLHALQVIPLMGYAIIQQKRRWHLRQQKGLVWIGSLAYLGVIALVTWQALRGEPLIYPTMATIIAWGVWASSIILATVAVLRSN